MSSRPKVSVLIPTYNYARYLPEAIESVLSQDITDFELIISDDGSNDGSAELLQRYATTDPRIRVQIQPVNLGMVANWNWCLQQARGEYIKFLFGDDRLSQPQTLGKMVAMLDAHESASLAVCARHLIDEHSAIFDLWDDLGAEGLQRGYDVGRRCLLQTVNLVGEPSVVLLRASRTSRGFDPRLRQVVDLEMWCHLLETGDLVYTKEPLCQFRRHALQQTAANCALQVGQREYHLLFDRYLDHYLPPDQPLSFRERKWLFMSTFRLQKDKKLHEVRPVTELLMHKLGRACYLGFWFLYRLVCPFQKLRRAWCKHVMHSLPISRV